MESVVLRDNPVVSSSRLRVGLIHGSEYSDCGHLNCDTVLMNDESVVSYL